MEAAVAPMRRRLMKSHLGSLLGALVLASKERWATSNDLESGWRRRDCRRRAWPASQRTLRVNALLADNLRSARARE